MTSPRTLRAKLADDRLCAGPFLKVADPAITELAGLAGFDFVVIDLEHSPFSLETSVGMVRAASARGIEAVIRVREGTGAELARVLDTGAGGVIVPHVGGADDARQVVEHARFHPLGSRGMDLYARAAGWGATDRDSYLRSANEEILLGVMVEASGAIEELGEIAAIPGLDLLFVGPYDLSQALGMPGQIDHPRVVEEVEKAAGTARANGRTLGVYVDDVATARRYAAVGVRFIGMANDADVLRRSFAAQVAQLHEPGG